MLTPLITIAIVAPLTPAQILLPEQPRSVLDYAITTETGSPTPVRLTFLRGDMSDPGTIFTNPNVDPNQLAVRRNVVYDIDGTGAITIPPGEWFVIASRGMEYDIATTHIGPSQDSHVQWNATLRRAIDTDGWAGGDFHLHTLTYSGHGDSNMPERMISIAGEGVEFAVATDHNHNTDYHPTMQEVGADPHFTAVTGNEISATYGHFNAYPLDPDAKVIDWHAEAPVMFAETRHNTNAWGVTPVIQVNHPRWGNIDYFGARDLNAFAAESTHPDWSWDFDAIEVLNENAGWGWYDAEVTDVPVRASRHSVVRDWINMVNAGHAVAPMGNSDSHAVEKNFAGIPRTYVQVDDTSPHTISPVQVAESVRRGAVVATTGPFIT
ncbi:MAG: CehA/McbA family metallohydrolase, partial [Phycisphaerae bacterium]|nr:CehA/McbA family metallohydrolase [Phycisphaerae bacterium]